MWKLLLLVATVGPLLAESVGEQVFLATHDNWHFYKIRATGPMTNANVRATCEAAGMGYPCHQSVATCARFPCVHGTCTDDVGGYNCSCENGWGGTNCDITSFAGQCYHFPPTAAAHPDAAQACQANNGHLADVTDLQQQSFLADQIATSNGLSIWLAFKTAPPVFLFSNGSPFSGPLQWSASEPAAPCDLCVFLDSSDSFLAKTAPCTEQHNYVCQDDLKPCGHSVCQNGGICGACFNDSTTYCDCPAGFGGKTCEIDLDECASGPCQNGGSCHDDINFYNCTCPIGYQGNHCESDMDWCSQVQCPHGFVCQDFTLYFLCAHPSAAGRGLPYQCSSASCPDGMYCTQEGVAAFSCKPE
ncbi:NOTCH2 [Branchiostoma lanceolatum]|uniref:NOTCH2 protein n=1 Tax=Branchiostoma lanceolatum TaxID=7740 RepID=A0A8K0ECB6_BRALA|nr:NOTCH2 [Branchiostoma lanceolatum]